MPSLAGDATVGSVSPAVYGLHGLRLRSELELAGFALGAAAHDLDVRRVPVAPVSDRPPPGDVVLRRDLGDGSPWYVASQRGRSVTLRVPGRSEFTIDRARRTVRCRTDPDADERLTGVLLAGLVVALVLDLDGHPVLHASAVQVDGAAIAFAGPPGAGKSTLATLMCAAGAHLVCDDVLRVELSGGEPICVAGAPQLRLRPQAVWAIQGFAGPPALGATVDGRLALAPPATPDARIPLGAIVLPRVTPTAERVGLRTLTGAEAVRALAGAQRIVGWTQPDRLLLQFERIARIAGCAHVVEATIPRGPASGEEIVSALLELRAPRRRAAAAGAPA